VTDDRLAPLLARIDELEAQAAFQDDLHRRLDETVARQDREILELKRQLKALGERIADLDAGAVGVSSPVDEVPPHY
jgi:uncharacterized coiled-coil protein SlyX